MNKRTITALVGVSGLLALCALTGCGNKTDDAATTTPPATAPSTASGAMSASPGAMASPATAPAPPGPKTK